MDNRDATIANLQQRLHQENQRRFEQIEKNQDNQKTTLEEILKNTVDLPKLKNDVEDLKNSHQRLKGGGIVISALLGAWEAVRFLFLKG